MNNKFSILWFGQRWNKYRRRDVELISRLANHPDIENIFLIEPPLPLTSIVNLWRKKFDEDAKDTWNRIKKHGIIWQPAKKIYVGTPLVPIFYPGKKIHWFYNFSRKCIAKWMMRRFEISHLVLWIGTPYFSSNLIGAFKENLSCYSLCEDFAEKDPCNRKLITKEDGILSNKSDLIFVVSEFLVQQHEKYKEKVHLVKNGVDVNSIMRLKDKSFPGDLQKIPHPIIGFVGGINEELDTELIFFLAKERPNWSIIMIGPISDSIYTKLNDERYSNVYFLGSKPFESVPQYIEHFDVCLLPYKNNKRNLSVSSMKMYIYLALGKPVVSRPVANVESLNNDNIISIANNSYQFLESIDELLIKNPPEARLARIAFANKQSWEDRAQYIYNQISKKLGVL